MPEVSVAVELRIAMEPGMDPVAFERAVDAEGKRASQALYLKALEALDEQAVEQSGGARQRLEPRWVTTIFGRIRINRWRIKPREETSYHPLDRLLHLGQSEASAAAREAICHLAVRIPFRQVAEVFQRISGAVVAHLTCWRVVQAEGVRLREVDRALVEAIFERAEPPPEMPPVDLVVVEADGTYLKSQREALDRFEVKTGVFYTGKSRAGGRKHKRWKLINKGALSTTADADAFGKALATKGFYELGLHMARFVVCAHDGLDEYGQTYHGWFPEAIHQIDHFHLAKKIHELTGPDYERYLETKELAFRDPQALAQKLRDGELDVEPVKAAEVAGYLTSVAPDLFGIDRLPRRLRRGRMRVVSTAVVEKHQDLLVSRRMKGKGMRWTKRGADNLLALQTRRFCDRWPTEWGVIAA